MKTGQHIDALNSAIAEAKVTWIDEDEGQPRDEVVKEIAEDMLRDYYSDNKIIFE